MTNSAAAAALDRIESDEAFAQRVKDAGGPEASIELLKSEGFDVTENDMRDAAIDRYGDQLTTEQLDALAAGVVRSRLVRRVGGCRGGGGGGGGGSSSSSGLRTFSAV